jgi:dihydrofolate reductase
MRRVIYGGACSLDGYLTDRDGGIDWLHHSKDVEQSWPSHGPRGHNLVRPQDMEFAAAQGGGPRQHERSEGVRDVANADEGAGKDTELVSSDAGAFVRALKQQPGKDIMVMSGGDFATSLLQAGAIDEIGLNIHPVLLGAGIPAFLDPERASNLELIECRPLDGGCVFVNYRVN